MISNQQDNSLLHTLAIRFGFVSEPVSHDSTIRNEIMSMVDDGCPNVTGDTQLYDLSTIWKSVPSKN